MAIKYLSGNRLQGTSAERLATVQTDSTLDFFTSQGSTGWTDSSSYIAYDSSNKKVDVSTDSYPTNLSDGFYLDLQNANYLNGSNIPTVFTFQFVLDQTAWSANSTCDFRDIGIWLSDGTGSSGLDSLALIASNTACSGASNVKKYKFRAGNGAGWKGVIDASGSTYERLEDNNSGVTPSTTQGANSDGKLGFKIIRESASVIKAEIWNDSTFGSGSSATNSYTFSDTSLCSTIDDLRYITIHRYKQGTANGSNEASFSDLKLTYTSSTTANIQTNAIFEESDTGKHYVFDGSSTWTEIA